MKALPSYNFKKLIILFILTENLPLSGNKFALTRIMKYFLYSQKNMEIGEALQKSSYMPNSCSLDWVIN